MLAKSDLDIFAKVIVHNTAEYGIMGIIGEIASLANEVGDHKKIMMAVNSGLSETRLGGAYIEADRSRYRKYWL